MQAVTDVVGVPPTEYVLAGQGVHFMLPSLLLYVPPGQPSTALRGTAR